MVQSSNVLPANARGESGKGPARRLRASGLIPAVVYGQKGPATHIAVNPDLLQKAIATPHKFNTLLSLQLDGSAKNVLFKDYAVDPVTRQLLHADFFEVDLSKPVRVEVPIVTTGKAEGVIAGGILAVSAHEIAVEVLPEKIPVQIEVDVTPIKIGGSIHIADVKAPEGVTIKYATNFTVAVVMAPEKEEVVAPVPGAAVPGAAEGAAAAPGAPGAPAAAAGAAGAPAAAGGAAPAAAPAKADAKAGGKK